MCSLFRVLIAIIIAAGAAAAQEDFGLVLLGRVRQHLAAGVTKLPNYTCQEAMDRSIYSSDNKVVFHERLRIEVLVGSSGELFAWPGSSGFSKDPIRSFIGGGGIANGSFGAELHNLFETFSAAFHYVGLETRNQEQLYRFDFQVPLLNSKYMVSVNGRSATTAYSGSFWVDKESLDLTRLDTRAEAIPDEIDCRDEHQSVTYDRVRIGTDVQLIPSAAELTIVNRDGHVARNLVTFSACHQYGSETSLSFNAVPDLPSPTQPRGDLRLPTGLSLMLRLEQPISSEESAVGDPIVAFLDKTVKTRSTSLPRGTKVFGQIRRLEQHFESHAWTSVGLQFYAAETSDGRTLFSARLIGPQGSPDTIRSVGSLEIVHGTPGLDIEDDGAGTGIGIFRIPGKELHLQRGFRTIWRTQ